MKTKTITTDYHKVIIGVLVEKEMIHLTIKVCTLADELISHMDGHWKSEYATEEEMNVIWGVPETHLQFVKDGRDFKNISRTAIIFVNNFCQKSLSNTNT
jgi:hypothetical protein